MKYAMSDALDSGSDCLGFLVEAQQYAVPFYEKLGFHVVGEPFLEANIIHYTMEKSASDR